MKWVRFFAGEWRLVATALVAGAIVHILATLWAGEIGQSRAYAALADGLPVNQPVFRGVVTPENQPLPFVASDSLYDYCRFDASTNRIRVTATLPEAGWSLALFSHKGENFYFVPGSDARATEVTLTLVPPGNVFVAASPTTPQSGPVIPEVYLPETKGIVILRAPIKGVAYQRLTDEQRSAFDCRPVR